MNVVVKEITEDEFRDSKAVLLFESGYLNSKFALVSNNNGTDFIIGWQSVFVRPALFELTQCNSAIGIDLDFSIIDFCTGKILMKLKLEFNFFDLVQTGNKLFIVTELEVIELSSIDYITISDYTLPDLVEDYSIKEDALFVKCADGNVLQFK